MRRKRILLGAAVALTAAWLLWPLPTDGTIMSADPVLAEGRAAYLAEAGKEPVERGPNVLIIVADDLGKYDTSLYGGTVPTPHLEQLAREGVKCKDGYVTSPVCSPSRCGLLTGRYQERFGNEMQFGDFYPHTRLELLVAAGLFYPTHLKLLPQPVYPTGASLHAQGLRQSEITLADVGRKQRYATGAVGKWHLGNAPGLSPLERGFDYHFGFYSAATTYVPDETDDIASYPHLEVTDIFLRMTGRRGSARLVRNGEVVDGGGYLTERIAAESVEFIARNKEKPFLLYVPFNAPHEPFQVPKKYLEQFSNEADENKRVYYGMIAALDDGVGRILQALGEAGLDENTLVFFTSDNGGAVYTGATTNAPLKGGKLSHFEGGVNVPFLMRWKGKLPEGAEYPHPVSTLDIFTTAAAAMHARLPEDRPIDGVDLVARVADGQPAHEALFWRQGASKAVRRGPWKLIVNERENRSWLYNLDDDPVESKDLAESKPEVVQELKLALTEWEKEMPPPLWPAVARAEWHFEDGLYSFDI